ncbi:MAG: restriction endonuclease subunit S [Lachnospiraceae bacterium]|nr:restriction endonuclease subunit S [Lachnospiraceae bacterium]
MNYKALKDIADITMGQSPESSSYNEDRDGLPFFQGNADFGDVYPEERVWCNAPKKIARAGDILISVRAPIGALNYAKEECCIGRGLAAISIKDEAKRTFVFRLLKAKNEELNRKGTGSTFKAIGKNVLEEIMVPEVSESRQSECMVIMDSLETIMRDRKKELSGLDTLIKARFVELFGDPEKGTCKYSMRRLGDLAVKVSDGVHAKPMYTETGYPFLSVVNINKGIVDFTDCKYVSEEAYQKMIKSTHPEKGDVLYTKVGATYGIPAYVDTKREFCLYVSVCLIKPKHEEINSRFLAIQMAMPSIKHQADARIKGIGVPDLHLNQIKEFDVICPPRELQDGFVKFVKQVDKSKVAVQKALDETQLLFDSLMQEYFG